MLQLIVDGVEYNCEGSWNDFTKKRLLRVMRAMLQPGTEGMRMMHTICAMLGLKTGWRVWFSKRSRQFWKTPPAYIQHIATEPDCLGWLRDEHAVLSEYVIRGFWHRGIYYQGPPKRMLRIPMAELVQSRESLVLYKYYNKPQFLADLIATLYRPPNPLWWFKQWGKDWTGDKRMPLNDYTYTKRKKRFATLPPELVSAICKQYSSALQLFQQQYPKVFKAGTKENARGRGWVDLLFSMSGGIFGTLRDTEMADCAEVFIKLEMDIIQADKVRKEIKQQ
jgi:hypothetical protein